MGDENAKKVWVTFDCNNLERFVCNNRSDALSSADVSENFRKVWMANFGLPSQVHYFTLPGLI